MFLHETVEFWKLDSSKTAVSAFVCAGCSQALSSSQFTKSNDSTNSVESAKATGSHVCRILMID